MWVMMVRMVMINGTIKVEPDELLEGALEVGRGRREMELWGAVGRHSSFEFAVVEIKAK